MADDLKKTPLYAEHVKLGGRLVPFAGFELPVQYSGIPAEHRAVRATAGLFDVSHMGEFAIRGAEAEAFVNYILTNDVKRLDVGQAQYTMMCNQQGGIIDDLLVYKFADWYRLVVNGANVEKDFSWVEHCLAERGGDVELTNESDDVALLALQGPESEAILAELTDVELGAGAIDYYAFTDGSIAGISCVISRTGYTGEDGFELYCDPEDASALWNALLAAGARRGLQPAGLGCRDTLRLEMGYALYGNDIDESTTPLQAGLGWAVKLNKGEFVGRGALLEQKELGVDKKLCGFELTRRGFPRSGYPVLCDGEDVGVVKSGTVGPTIGKGIGTVYLPSDRSVPETEIVIVIRNEEVPAQVKKMPFYSGGSLKR